MVLARYLLIQLTGPFVFGLALFSGVLLLEKFFDVVDLLINKSVSLELSVRVFALFFPTVLSLSVPMSLLLACLLTFGRLSEDSEITALRASGLSFGQILWPPLLWAAALCALLVPFNTTWAPRSIGAFRSLYFEIANQDPLIKIEPGQFVQIRDVRLYAEKVDRVNNILGNVWIHQRGEKRIQRIYARSGVARADAKLFTLNLRDGQIQRVSRGQERNLLHIRFKHYTLQVPFVEPSDARGLSRREKTSWELKEEISLLEAQNLPSGEVLAEYHLRYAVSFAPLALALLGITLGMTLERGGRGVGLGASVGVIFVYYLLLILGVNMAEKGVLPPIPALWLANAAALVAGLILYRKRLIR